jgi:hypothetical protein
MAQVNYSKKGNKIVLSGPKRDGSAGTEVVEFVDAMEAFAAKDAWEAALAKQGKASNGPVTCKQAGSEDKGMKPAMVVYYGDQTKNGRFPVGTFYGSQFHAMIAGLPAMIETYNELVSQGKIDQTWDAKQGKAAPVTNEQISSLVKAITPAPATV